MRGVDVALRADVGGRRRRPGRTGPFGARRKRIDQRAVVARRQLLAGIDRGDHLADAVDHGENGADQRGIGRAAAGAAIGQRVLGGVAQRLKPREIEEAAIALHRVDEAENAVEPRAVVGIGLPGDDLAAQRFEHFPALGHEIGNKIVHWRQGPTQESCGPSMPPRS